MKNAVFTAFTNEEQLDKALHEFRVAGFLPSQISYLFPDRPGQKSFSSDQVTRVSEGAEWGAALGFFLGASAGILAGLGTVQFPFFHGVDPWLGSVIGAILGAVLGAGSGALVGIGTPAAPAARYARYLDDGGILFSVHAESSERADEAAVILERCGGADIARVNEADAWRLVFAHSKSFRPRSMPGRFKAHRGQPRIQL